MLFNSYEFLTFLPIVWAIWFVLRRRGLLRCSLCVLAIASFVFYGFHNPMRCLLLGASILVNYGMHLGLTNKKAGNTIRIVFLILGLLFDVGLLFYFKYLDFSIENINRVLHLGIGLRHIALPLGISFYSFQQLSFVIDSFQRKMERYSFLEYCVYVSFFPQLVAGPIVLHQELIPQLQEKSRKVQTENIQKGIEYFVIGFAKKVLVADRFALFVNAGYGNVFALNTPVAVLVILGYTLQIYFDFSGYCDMALGLGYLFGVKLPINFDSPYKAINISEFWKRWHITLTRFFTTYLYIPLGGSRKGIFRTCINIMIIFAVSGLWHGAAWTFVAWGIMHGLAQVFWRLCGKWLEKLPKWINWLLTFGFVNVAWCFFRAEYMEQPVQLFGRVLHGGFAPISVQMAAVLCEDSYGWVVLQKLLSESSLLLCGQVLVILWFVIWTVVCVKAPSSHELVNKEQKSGKWFVWLGFIFAVAFMSLTRVSEFIYFNF